MGGPRKLPEHEALGLVERYGLRVPRHTYVEARGLEGLVERVRGEGLRPPLALKVSDPGVLHKSDVGGVELGVDLGELGERAQVLLERVAQRLGRTPEGLLVQEMAPGGGVEFIVGGLRDGVFGPTVLVGAGGVLVELYGDVSLRVAPFTREEARVMVSEIKASRLLYGYRGMPQRDVEALLDAVMGVQRLLMEEPHVTEVDVNPVIVYEKGALAVDARVILGKGPEKG